MMDCMMDCKGRCNATRRSCIRLIGAIVTGADDLKKFLLRINKLTQRPEYLPACGIKAR
jgi:hypothetical protein